MNFGLQRGFTIDNLFRENTGRQIISFCNWEVVCLDRHGVQRRASHSSPQAGYRTHVASNAGLRVVLGNKACMERYELAWFQVDESYRDRSANMFSVTGC